MKAALLLAYGDTKQFSYADAPTPVAGEGEVLVKVEASSLNPVDLFVRLGYLAQMAPLTLPAVIGLDFAGTVTAVGPRASGYGVGDRVIGKQPVNGHGSHAEFVAAKTTALAKLPANVSFTAGATLPLAALTGRQAVDALGEVAGKRVLVTGALGAAGRAAVQYLLAKGAVPVAGVRASRLGEARALAGEAIDIEAAVAAPKSFDAAITNVGGPTVATAIGYVKDGGVLAAVAGVPDGDNADGRIRIAGIYTVDDAPMLQAIADDAGAGRLTLPVAATLTLAEVAKGHDLQAGGGVGGKIVFVP